MQNDYGMPVSSIVQLEQLIEYLQASPDSAESLQQIRDYRERYGI